MKNKFGVYLHVGTASADWAMVADKLASVKDDVMNGPHYLFDGFVWMIVVHAAFVKMIECGLGHFVSDSVCVETVVYEMVGVASLVVI